MKILYIAYSCLPLKGSEEKIGWNIPVESAKTNTVYVITKEEHRQKIEEYTKQHQINNIKFYFVDIPKIYKKVFKGTAYFARLNLWHKKALPLAKEICKKEQIEIIHQITPIEFRSIGDYGKIPNTKFVCGPLGGGEFLPKELKCYARKNIITEKVRQLINSYYKHRYKQSKKLNNCDYILFANNETKEYLNDLTVNIPNCLFFDNGISQEDFATTAQSNNNENHKANENENHKANDNTNNQANNKVVLLVCSRLAYRKGHRFLLDVLKQLPADLNYQCRIVGTGPDLKKIKNLCNKYNLDNRVVFTGRIPYESMTDEYKNAHVMIMPSIRETTGAVLLEAMSKGLPVITINKFGGPVLLDENSGWLYHGKDKKDYQNALKSAIVECITNPSETARRGANAQQSAKQGLWQNKMSVYNEIYKNI